MTTSCTSAWRIGSNTLAECSSASCDFLFGTTKIGIEALSAIPIPPASLVELTTRRMSIGSSPRSLNSMRLRSVVPPPEIKTAIGKRDELRSTYSTLPEKKWPAIGISTLYSPVRQVAKSVFLSLPPNAQFAGCSANEMIPRSLPAAETTCTPMSVVM